VRIIAKNTNSYFKTGRGGGGGGVRAIFVRMHATFLLPPSIYVCNGNVFFSYFVLLSETFRPPTK